MGQDTALRLQLCHLDHSVCRLMSKELLACPRAFHRVDPLAQEHASTQVDRGLQVEERKGQSDSVAVPPSESLGWAVRLPRKTACGGILYPRCHEVSQTKPQLPRIRMARMAQGCLDAEAWAPSPPWTEPRFGLLSRLLEPDCSRFSPPTDRSDPQARLQHAGPCHSTRRASPAHPPKLPTPTDQHQSTKTEGAALSNRLSLSVSL